MAVAQEGANRWAMKRNKDVSWVCVGSPRDDDDSQTFERKWFTHLHWKRWTQERMGPAYAPVRLYG